jgi:hypothetical protein
MRMRQITGVLGLGFLLLAGCTDNWRFMRQNQQADRGLPVESLTADKIVQALNANATRIQSLESHNVSLACSQGLQSFNLDAFLVAQKPHNFRLVAQVLKKTEVDFGSNNQEFWWWIGRSDPPYLYHCSYQDFAKSQGRIPLPFQPDWIIEALGMATYDSPNPYQVVPGRGNTVELVERTVSPQGQPVQKVTQLTRGPNQIQVTGHVLRDQQGHEICSATVTQVQRVGDALLPRRVEMRWPAEKVRMTMTLNDVQVNGVIPPERVARLFNRPNLQGVSSVDLAQGVAAPTSAIRRAGVTFQNR